MSVEPGPASVTCIRRHPIWRLLLGGAGAMAAADMAAGQGRLGLLAIVLLVGTAAAVFLFRHHDLIFWLLVFTAPFTDKLGISAGPINVRPYNLLACAGLAWMAWHLMEGGGTAPWRIFKYFKGLFVCVGLFVMAKAMTVYYVQEMPMTMTRIFIAKYMVFTVLLFATMIVTTCFCTSRSRLETTLRWWLHTANGITFWGLMQLVISNVTHIELVHHRDVLPIGRAFSVFREPDVLGSFVGATVVMILPLLIANVSFVSRKYLTRSLMFQGVMLLIVFVRAAWVAVMVCLCLAAAQIYWTSLYKRFLPYVKKAVLGGVFGGILLMLLVPSFAETVHERFASIFAPGEESASDYRMQDLSAMFRKALPGPLTSTGTFLFGHGDLAWSYWAPTILREKYDRGAMELMEAGHAVLVHPGFNATLCVLFDNGLLGLILYVAFWILLVRGYFRHWRTVTSDIDRALQLATFLPVLCIFICFQFSNDPITPFFWCLIGLNLAARFHTDPVAFAPAQPSVETSS